MRRGRRAAIMAGGVLGSAPTAPSSLSATARANALAIDLAWTDNASTESGFQVERSPDNSVWTVIGTVGANVVTYADLGLAEVTQYYYRVRAYNSWGTSAYTTAADATTTGTPAAPSNLAAVAFSDTEIDLTWDDNASNETGFELERSANGTTGWAQIATPAANATSASNTGLTAATQYFYRLRAVNAYADSAYSSTANATTNISGITDSFNRANSAVTLGNTDTGQTWVVGQGTWGIISNRAYCVANGSSNNVVTVTGTADGTLTVTLVDPAGASGGSSRIVTRYSNTSNYVFLLAASATPYVLMKREAGSNGVIAAGSIGGAAVNDVVKIVQSGTSIKVYINDVLDIDQTVTFNASATGVGLGTDFGLDGAPRFDDFSFAP